MTFRSSIVLLVMTAGLFVGAEASAQATRASLEEGPVVRRRILFRSDRFELLPQMAMTLNDTYKRNIMAGIGGNYYLTNEFGIGASFVYAAVHPNTDLLDSISAEADRSVREGLKYAVPQFGFDAALLYAPIVGKLSALDNFIVNYDFHVMLGAGGVSVTSDSEGASGGDFEGLKLGPMIGFGGRFFVTDSIAITVDFKDLIYSAADIQEGDEKVQEEFRNNLQMSLGVSFFFPGDVGVSR